ncbi:hypothetical protein MFUL124B02_34945 [Myxococcus fulvus 124B02]|nr:hypothetical protein MFUL124B02_34945 [Myxococcus fulvus 124B02]
MLPLLCRDGRVGWRSRDDGSRRLGDGLRLEWSQGEGNDDEGNQW